MIIDIQKTRPIYFVLNMQDDLNHVNLSKIIIQLRYHI